MRKTLFLIMSIIGALIIFAGVGLQVLNKGEKKEDKPKFEDDPKVVTLNEYNKEEKCSTDGFVKTFIRNNYGDETSISYPGCVHEYNLSYKSKLLYDQYLSSKISMNISYSKKNISKIVNNLITTYMSRKSDDYYKEVKYSDAVKGTSKKGYAYKVVNGNFKRGVSEDYMEVYSEWAIGIDLGNEQSLDIEITVEDGIISFDTIKKMIDSVEVFTDKATYTNTTEVDGKLVGYLKQNYYKEWEHGTMLKVSLPTKYKEQASTGSNFDYSSFELDEGTTSTYYSYSIDHTTGKDYKEDIKSYQKSYMSSYKESENYKKVKQKSGKRKINNKEFDYIEVDYDYISKEDGHVIAHNYKLLLHEQIKDENIVRIVVELKNIKPTEKFLEQIVNYEVETY